MNVQNISFKGVYRVADEREKPSGGIQIIEDHDAVFYNNSGTEKLYKFLNPEHSKMNKYANKDILLIEKGELVEFINVGVPKLILTNKNGKDAKRFLNLAQRYNNKLQELGGMTEEQLEKKLTRREIAVAKNPTDDEIKSLMAGSYKDRLISAIDNKQLKPKLQADENKLYDKFLQKVKILKSEDIDIIKKQIISSFTKIVSNL